VAWSDADDVKMRASSMPVHRGASLAEPVVVDLSHRGRIRASADSSPERRHEPG
jgi:hypothetical protein